MIASTAAAGQNKKEPRVGMEILQGGQVRGGEIIKRRKVLF